MLLTHTALTLHPGEFALYGCKDKDLDSETGVHQCRATSRLSQSVVAAQKQCQVGRSWLHESRCSHDSRHESVRWYHPRNGDQQHRFSHRSQEKLCAPHPLSIGFLKHPQTHYTESCLPCLQWARRDASAMFHWRRRKSFDSVSGEERAQFVGGVQTSAFLAWM